MRDAQISELTKRVRGIEEKLDAKTYYKIHERTSRLSKRMQALVIRDAVCTEVSRCYPRLSMALCRMRDFPDEFWLNRDNMSIDEWKDYIDVMEP